MFPPDLIRKLPVLILAAGFAMLLIQACATGGSPDGEQCLGTPSECSSCRTRR